jgi:hypothetical protein
MVYGVVRTTVSSTSGIGDHDFGAEACDWMGCERGKKGDDDIERRPLVMCDLDCTIGLIDLRNALVMVRWGA